MNSVVKLRWAYWGLAIYLLVCLGVIVVGVQMLLQEVAEGGKEYVLLMAAVPAGVTVLFMLAYIIGGFLLTRRPDHLLCRVLPWLALYAMPWGFIVYVVHAKKSAKITA